ncbi:hypothetical protein WP50_07800 [Lactiplantibacillus plantarum]|nr:hypothetical protein WP50_07800 [Lactiplantibacillus plantarum]
MATDLAYYQKLLSNGNYKAINWDRVSDAIDKSTWEKLTEQFWLDTRIPVSNDMADWRELDDDHRWVVGHVFGGLTLSLGVTVPDKFYELIKADADMYLFSPYGVEREYGVPFSYVDIPYVLDNTVTKRTISKTNVTSR